MATLLSGLLLDNLVRGTFWAAFASRQAKHESRRKGVLGAWRYGLAAPSTVDCCNNAGDDRA